MVSNIVNLYIGILALVLATKAHKSSTILHRDIADFLNNLNLDFLKKANTRAKVNWLYTTQYSNQSEKLWLESEVSYATLLKERIVLGQHLKWGYEMNKTYLKQWDIVSYMGEMALPELEYRRYLTTIMKMEKVYHLAKICPFDKKSTSIALEREVIPRIAVSRDPHELKYLWSEITRVLGYNLKPKYESLLPRMINIAKMNNFDDISEMWMSRYQIPNLKKVIKDLWTAINPMYVQLHAFVRQKLREKYGVDFVPARSPIPIQFVGDLWGQTWENIADIALPYSFKWWDINTEMYVQGYSVKRMFQLAENYMIRMNMSILPSKFWKNSILEISKDIAEGMVCYATVIDFYENSDIRVRSCTKVSFMDLMRTFKLIAKAQYFHYYRNQPFIFRNYPNIGIFEGLTSFFVVAAQNMNYLTRIHLLKADLNDPHVRINWLLFHALRYIPQLAYAFIVELWRWNVMENKVKLHKFNCEYWRLVNEIAGLEAAVDRTEKDFDVVTKYHVIKNWPLFDYFIGIILQYQIFRSVCMETGEYNPETKIDRPLFECNVDGNRAVGMAIAETMRFGSSRNWTDILYVLTGQRELDAIGVLDYFQPLLAWLQRDNHKTKTVVGWSSSSRKCHTV